MADHERYLPPSVSHMIHGIGLDDDTVLDRMIEYLQSLRRRDAPIPKPNGITYGTNHGGGGPGEGNPRYPWWVPSALDVQDLPPPDDD